VHPAPEEDDEDDEDDDAMPSITNLHTVPELRESASAEDIDYPCALPSEPGLRRKGLGGHNSP